MNVIKVAQPEVCEADWSAWMEEQLPVVGDPPKVVVMRWVLLLDILLYYLRYISYVNDK